MNASNFKRTQIQRSDCSVRNAKLQAKYAEQNRLRTKHRYISKFVPRVLLKRLMNDRLRSRLGDCPVGIGAASKDLIRHALRRRTNNKCLVRDNVFKDRVQAPNGL